MTFYFVYFWQHHGSYKSMVEGKLWKIMNLNIVNKSVDCRFKDLYVDIDFAQIIGVDCRQTCKIVVEFT